MPQTVNIYESTPYEVADVSRVLMERLGEKANRKDFLRVLAETLHPVCNFSWLTISLGGQHEEMVADFSIPGKHQINPFAPVLPQSLTYTVAEYVQDTKNHIIIPDCMEYFQEMSSPPIFQQSVTSVIAMPLMLNAEIAGTLLVSYENKPDNFYKIASYLSWLAPSVSACLGVVRSLERLKAERPSPAAKADDNQQFSPSADAEEDAEVVSRSPAMRAIFRQVNALAPLNVPVLLLGETGTGKSMIARYIHENSLRSAANFVRVNCPSLASSLFESEMFGHAKGSFTGATKNRVGRFELAHGGTLFLDEVAELSMDMQSKLLQVLDDMSFERVGESVPIMVDMRIVAATNVHIGEAIREGRLRGDLFHRISVYTIELPPLRKRPDDVAPLAMSLSARASERMGLADLTYTPSIIEALTKYYWPGNTRELSNLMTRLLIAQNVNGELSRGTVDEIIAQSESMFVVESENQKKEPVQLTDVKRDNTTILPSNQLLSLAEVERQHITEVLKSTGGVIAGPKGAAKILGLPRSTLLHRMRKLGIRASDYAFS